MNTRTILIILGVVAAIIVLGVIFIPRLSAEKQAQAPQQWPATDWPAGTLEQAGLDSAKMAQGLLAIQQAGSLIDSLAVIRNGELVLDAYFSPYDGSFPHDLASVTKSFMTTLIGIAIDQGKLKLDDPVLSFFPERTIANRDARKEKMTVRDLVSMRNGFESGCLAGDQPTLAKMTAEPDWVQAALDRPMTTEPGSEWCYDSPGMHLLSAILQKATGQTAAEFARQYLFEPLGIEETYWRHDPQGFTRGWGDLHLKPLDAARLGYLWLNRGVWNGRQIVSSQWVSEAVKYHSDFGEGDGYGYGWWLWDSGYGASGRGGQSVKVEPALEVIVVTTGSGFDYDSEIDPHILAAVVDLEKPLPDNPEGQTALAAAQLELAEPQSPQALPALPELAGQISGQTIRFERNPAELETLRLEFDNTAQAVMHVQYYGDPQVHTSTLGLDGVYRVSTEGDLRRGRWADARTFVLDIADVDNYMLEFNFDGQQVKVFVPLVNAAFEGRLEGGA